MQDLSSIFNCTGHRLNDINGNFIYVLPISGDVFDPRTKLHVKNTSLDSNTYDMIANNLNSFDILLS